MNELFIIFSFFFITVLFGIILNTLSKNSEEYLSYSKSLSKNVNVKEENKFVSFKF